MAWAENEVTRREALKWMLAGSAAAAAPPLTGMASAQQAQGPSPASRPNVLFIAVDDLNTALGTYGHPLVQSPHIDALASRGVRFDRAYCQFPLCNPSRASLLSGRRPDTVGVKGLFTNPREKLGDVPFLPEWFSRHGYFTARVGKINHNRFESAIRWDVSEDTFSGIPEGLSRDEVMKYTTKWEALEGDDTAGVDGQASRRVVQLIEQQRNRPWFIGVGFMRPHVPLLAPRRYFDRYRLDDIRLPVTPAGDRDDIPPTALKHNPLFAALDERARRQLVLAWYACTSYMDAQVGILLDALDRLQLAERTVVVLFGDNGYHLGEHGGLWDKDTLFEESIRVPLLMAGPGVSKGTPCRRLVELIDLYPSLTDLCGLPQAEGMEGRSLAPLLGEPSRPWTSAAFSQVERADGRAIVTERWKLIEWPGTGEAELYDLEADPHEHVNLAARAEHAATRRDLKSRLNAGWRASRP